MVATHVVSQHLYAANQHQFAMLAIHVLLSAVAVSCTSFSTSIMLIAVAMQLLAANQLQLLAASQHQLLAAMQLLFAAIHVLLATAT